MFRFRFYSNLPSNCYTLEERIKGDWVFVAELKSMRDVWGILNNIVRVK